MSDCGFVRITPATAAVTAVPCNFTSLGQRIAALIRNILNIFFLAACLAVLTLLSSCGSSNGSSSSAPTITINAQNGSAQSAVVGKAFAIPLSAVVDENGSPLSGVTVTFTAPSSGGASGAFANGKTTETDTTNSSGVATSTTFTANTNTGNYSVSATTSGAATPATFGLTNVAAPTITINAQNGSMQSALVNTAFALPLSAVVDQNGSPLSGVTVTFTAPSSGGASGTFAGNGITDSAVTDSNGIATSTSFTANATVGTYTVSATLAGATAPAGFSLTNKTLTIGATGGTPQSAVVGSPFTAPLVATVVDNNNNRQAGVLVSFAAPVSGQSGTFSGGAATETDTTDSNGVATSTTFTANSDPGAYLVTATAPGASAPANFNLTNTSNAAGVFATSGPQSANVSTPFANPLVATVVDGGGNPLPGVSVTFTAPASGASGTFAGGATTLTAVSDTNGHATSSTFAANATAGGPYNVTATTGALAPANFILTNITAGTTLTSYTFYLSGQSQSHPSSGSSGINFYALVGAVTIDQNGNVTGGEEDYNDGNTYTYSNVPISGGSLTVSNTTGQGTLVLTTNNANLGVSDQETFGVQFVNASHALIMQFDGSATSSGSMDVQNLTTPPSGGYAFTLSGVEPYGPVALGGVLVFSGNLLNPSWPGTIDVNDTVYGISAGAGFAANVSAVDAYGRGQITGISALDTTLTLNYYQIGPEAVRIIDMDASIAAVGSAFGQGANATSATAAGLGASVLAITGNPFSSNFGVLGQFTTDGSGNLSSGVADDNEFGNGVSASDVAITGTYTVGTNGYGTVTITPGQLGNVSSLGLYLTDPKLNLNDPNNSTGGGGALLLDLDTKLPTGMSLAGGTGVVTPQTDTATADFNGPYAAGWQEFNQYGEFDMLAQGTMTSSSETLSLQGIVSDPLSTLTANPSETFGDSFGSTPQSDSSNLGRYTMLSPNQLQMMITTSPAFFDAFDVILYQASQYQLYWLEVDTRGVFVGPLEQQGSLTGIPAAKRRVNIDRRPRSASPFLGQREWKKRAPSTP